MLPHPHKLLLMPGMDGTELLFEPLRKALPASIEVHVATFPLSTSHGYAELLELTSTQLRQIGPCTVLAWSFSGPLAVLLQQRHPELVRGLILVASFVRCPLPWLRPIRALVRYPVFTAIRALRRLPLRLRHGADDRYRQVKAELWHRVSGRILAFRARQVLGLDVRAQFRACKAPVTYFVSSSDHIVPRSNLGEIRRLKPATSVIELEGDHFALYFQTETARAAIVEFLDRVESDFRQTRS